MNNTARKLDTVSALGEPTRIHLPPPQEILDPEKFRSGQSFRVDRRFVAKVLANAGKVSGLLVPELFLAPVLKDCGPGCAQGELPPNHLTKWWHIYWAALLQKSGEKGELPLDGVINTYVEGLDGNSRPAYLCWDQPHGSPMGQWEVCLNDSKEHLEEGDYVLYAAGSEG